MKQVIKFNATTKECLPVMKFLYVSSKYAIIMNKILNYTKSFYFVTELELSNNQVIIEREYEFLKNVTNTIGNKIFQYLCYENNKKTINIEKSNTLEEKVRAYLQKIEICKTVEADKIYRDHFIKDICYNFMPIITKKGELMFADKDNHLHHYLESRKCNNMVNEKLLVYSTNEKNNDRLLYEVIINWILHKLHLYDKKMKLGWWTLNLHSIGHFIVGLLLIISIPISIVILYYLILLGQKIYIFKIISVIFNTVYVIGTFILRKSGNILLNVRKDIRKHYKIFPNNSTIIEEMRNLKTNT
ncbi:Hypothetical protein SRAE_X000236650 [Strongyloides ratti]|uniref:Uncharacterized protein n=1 Tax=Strongyloides ratti TaxID=34506 RepID=A0A090KXN6_STRRB|nr:Hypothetical protein SRAE_X000236650 [Strongyloides ratti]CEF60632.1 Hypothetical protein SRAE_X000236650 [Strongyloides ratti]